MSIVSVKLYHALCNIAGILQKGDGSIIEFTAYPRLLTHVVGSGRKRPFQCGSNCEAQYAKTSDLMNVVSLTSGPDGSMYIGDYNLVRRVIPETGETHTILEFE